MLKTGTARNITVGKEDGKRQNHETIQRGIPEFKWAGTVKLV
jgi:hypothetical protein